MDIKNSTEYEAERSSRKESALPRKNFAKCAHCGANRNRNPDRRFFLFPRDQERCKQWVQACGRSYLLNKSPKTLSQYYKLCSSHFEDEAYASSKKWHLLPTAVPTKFSSHLSKLDPLAMQQNLQIKLLKEPLHNSDEVQVPNVFEVCNVQINDSSSLTQDIPVDDSIALGHNLLVDNPSSLVYSPSLGLSSNLFDTSTPIRSTPKSNRSTIRVVTPKTRKIKALSSKLYYLKKKYSNRFSHLSEKNTISCVLNAIRKSVSPIVYNFIACQLKQTSVSRCGRRWSVSDKNLALQIYLTSPKAYANLRNTFHLPSKQTLLKSISAIKLEPGFSDVVLNAIKLLASKLKDHDKYCIISFDEMSLKAGLSYNRVKDSVDGFENYGSYSERSPKLATHALVFMARGLCKKWKQVFGYFFSSHTAPAALLKVLVTQAVSKLFECGLKPIAIVCDQGANNQKLFAKELAVNEIKPYFFVNDIKIYTLFDVPHLVKSMRNNFRRYTVKFSDGKTAFWEHIVSLWEFDSQMPHRIVPKLNMRHIEVNGLSSMNVSLAAQVFSHSVASALCYLSVLKHLPSSASHTADFCSIMNDLFESLNSRVLKHKTRPLLSAVTKNSSHVEFWKTKMQFLKSIQFDTKGAKIVFPCLKGWIISLSAVSQMIPDILTEIPFILMSRFTQDALENFFSLVRRKGGNNDHPTPNDFQQRLRMLMAQNIISTCGIANCEPDDDTILLPVEVLTTASNNMSCISNSNISILSEPAADDSLNHVQYFLDCDMEEHDLLTQNSSAYVAGFIVKRFLNRFQCEECKHLLVGEKTLTESTIFLYFKEFDNVKKGLFFPSTQFTMTVCELGKRFSSMFDEMYFKDNIVKSLINYLKNVDHDWLSCANHETEAWDYIVLLYVKLMLYYKIKSMSKSFVNRKKSVKKLHKLN